MNKSKHISDLLKQALRSPGGKIVLEYIGTIIGEFTENGQGSLVECGSHCTYITSPEWRVAVNVLLREAARPNVEVYIHVPGQFTYQSTCPDTTDSLIQDLERETVATSTTHYDQKQFVRLINVYRRARAIGIDSNLSVMRRARTAIEKMLGL